MISHVNSNARSDLILPLRREDLSVDPRDVDSRGEAELVVDLLDVAGDGDSGTSRAVVGSLGGGESSLRPSKGPLGLALQGIGAEEAEAFSLLLEEDGLLRQLAGNAFCANVCLVFLIAALLFS